MTIATPCTDAIRAAAGPLSDDEVLEIAEAIQRRRKALAAQGKIDVLDQELARAARTEGDKAKLAAALARKHAALNVIVRDRLERQVLGHVEAGLSYRKAVLAVLEGTMRGIAGGRQSVAAHRLAFEARYVGEMMATIQRERPHLIALLDDQALMADAVREMHEIRDGGRPGVSGNADARFLAETFAAHAERARLDLNRLGATIGKLAGWAGPQAHDPYRLLAAGRERWVDETLALLDIERTFADVRTDTGAPDVAAMRAILADIYTTLITGRDATITARERGEVTGPANLARSLERHRVLHFRGADAWLAYHQQYGLGSLFSAMVAHQSRAARLAAQMTVLGPNPKAMLDGLLERLQRRARTDPALDDAKREGVIRALSSEGGGSIASAYAEMAGLTATPADVSAAKIGSGIRAVQAMAKLGGAVISAVPGDIVMGAANLRFNGLPLWQAYRELLGSALKGRGAAEQRELAFLIGEGFDGLIGHIISPHVAGDGVPGAMSRAMTTFFRWSGLSWQTDAMRAAGARVLAAHLGRQLDHGWEQLPERLRHVFGLHGLEERHWQAIRQAGVREVNGTPYLTPERIAALPDDAIAPLAEDALAAMRAGVAERIAAAARADAREQQWIEGRIRRFQDHLAGARDRLHELEGRRAARDEGERARLAERIRLLEAGVDRAAAETDLIQSVRGIETAEKIRDWLRAVEDGTFADAEAGRARPRIERTLRGTFAAAERLGRRIGDADRRITLLKARIRAADRAAASDARSEAFLATWRARAGGGRVHRPDGPAAPGARGADPGRERGSAAARAADPGRGAPGAGAHLAPLLRRRGLLRPHRDR